MKIAIIAAMDQELEFLLKTVKIKKKKEKGPFVFYIGKHNKNTIIIAKSGVGKTAAGMLFATLNNEFKNISLVINIGSAGGCKEKVQVFDMIVIEGAVYGDVDIRLGGNYVYGQMSKCPEYFKLASEYIPSEITNFKTGFIMTCDTFMTDKVKIDNVVNDFFSGHNIVCYDMETASFAQAAYFYKIPFLATRCISDIVGENDYDAFSRNIDKACDI